MRRPSRRPRHELPPLTFVVPLLAAMAGCALPRTVPSSGVRPQHVLTIGFAAPVDLYGRRDPHRRAAGAAPTAPSDTLRGVSSVRGIVLAVAFDSATLGAASVWNAAGKASRLPTSMVVSVPLGTARVATLTQLEFSGRRSVVMTLVVTSSVLLILFIIALASLPNGYE